MQTPTIEKVTVERSTITLKVDMQLASIPVTVHGSYNVQTNAYDPTSVTIRTHGLSEWSKDTNEELQFFCNALGWDYENTKAEIKETVRSR